MRGMISFPSPLKNGLFTIAAIDNIDHNQSSSTAKSSFHGTSISIFQHPQANEVNNQIFKIDNKGERPSSKPTLPNHFTSILPIKSGRPEYPKKPSSLLNNTSNNALPLRSGEEWLSLLRKPDEAIDKEKISFAAYHSVKLELPEPVKDISVMLPLLTEYTNSPAMVFHCMKVIKQNNSPFESVTDSSYYCRSTNLRTGKTDTVVIPINVFYFNDHAWTITYRNGIHERYLKLVEWKWLDRCVYQGTD